MIVYLTDKSSNYIPIYIFNNYISVMIKKNIKKCLLNKDVPYECDS